MRIVRTKLAGRINPLLFVVIIALILAFTVIYSLTGGDSPETVARRFMTALAEGNVQKLTELSYMGDESKEQVEKQWDYACHVAGPHYIFTYTVKGTVESEPETAAVKLSIIRDANKPGVTDDYYEIPLTKQNGKWLVDVRSLNYKLYPALPK